jgi:hypothetical protein
VVPTIWPTEFSRYVDRYFVTVSPQGDVRNLTADLRGALTPHVKQAVISAFALSLLYPAIEIPGYSREAFVADLINEAEADIRGALDAGAANVQIDFTEGRLSLKLDPPGNLLRSFVELNNQVLKRFVPDERSALDVDSMVRHPDMLLFAEAFQGYRLERIFCGEFFTQVGGFTLSRWVQVRFQLLA